MIDEKRDAIEPMVVMESKAPEPLPIGVEVEAHIRATAGKPVYITVTYMDSDDKLQHFQKLDRGFKPEDILISLVAIGEDADRNLIKPKAVLRIEGKRNG